ncbi:MAG TPA: LLM class flavin-dependent oxidoreductase [Actinomycetota bacterium]|nr:LLM class flavin-dependent oxidoreductase [Actinomycetota bacterium]
MKTGLALPHYDFSYPDGRSADLAATVEWACRAETLGYDSVWVSDHFFLEITRYGGPPGRHGSLEPLAALGAIAAATERVRLGTLVLSEAFRPPPMLAKAAATLDVASGGRLEIGMGAGWYEDEYAAYGYPFGSAGERMQRLEEAVRIVGGLLDGGPVTFEGEHYAVRDAINEPRPVQRPRPPIWIGSKGGPRAARIVAEAADGWNTVWKWTPEDYAAKAATLDEACERAGRDPAGVRRSLGLYTLVGDDLPKLFEAVRDWAPGTMLEGTSLEEFAAGALVGTAEQCAERMAAFAHLGADELIVAPAPLPFAIAVPEQVEAVAETLIPLLRDL